MNTTSIKPGSALISVFYKDGLEPLLEILSKHQVTIYSTGGTAEFISKLGHSVTLVEDLTGFPAVFGGRVKTLHPAVMGGILKRRKNPADEQEAQAQSIPEIDLVVVDLYPFEETLKSTTDESLIIEKIDIGGISLIRAAAKNHRDVAVCATPASRKKLIGWMASQDGTTTLEQRKELAADAFAESSRYDVAIANYFSPFTATPQYRLASGILTPLRYGENPHQKGFFAGNLNECFTKLSGKDLSYNNLLDVEAAIDLCDDFEEPFCAIIKHNNACGAALAADIATAYSHALASDPLSAFGGIIILNRVPDLETLKTISNLFFEVLIAPGFPAEYAHAFEGKPNRILLQRKPFQKSNLHYRNLLNGTLLQDFDTWREQEKDLTSVTVRKPDAEQTGDLLFAARLARHSKSNTIILVKNKRLIGAGAGLTSRVDALKLAIQRAEEFGHDLRGAAMASDAFFPFPDCVEIAASKGITAILQPGGSLKDQLSVEEADRNGIAMVFTGVRHFRH